MLFTTYPIHGEIESGKDYYPLLSLLRRRVRSLREFAGTDPSPRSNAGGLSTLRPGHSRFLMLSMSHSPSCIHKQMTTILIAPVQPP